MVEVPDRTGNYGPIVPPVASDLTPLSTVLVVDPDGTGTVRNGAFSGAKAFLTLQEAYDTIAPGGFATIFCCPGVVGPLVIPVTAAAGQAVTVYGAGGIFGALVQVSGLTIGTANRTFFEFVNVQIAGDITDVSAEAGWPGNVVLRTCEVDGSINLPTGILEAYDECSISSPNLAASQIVIEDAQRLPQDILATRGLLSLDAVSEKALFGGSGVTATTLQTGAQITRLDDAVPDGQIAPNAAHTFSDNVRAIVQPGFITAPRTYQLDHTNGTVAGAIVDVWPQGFDVTIQDESAAALITVPASSAPIRLFFFGGPPDVNFVLSGAQSLFS